MATHKEEPKVEMVCERCGSEDVSRDAWGDWDSATQDWVLRTVFDNAYCHACEGETNIEERPWSSPRFGTAGQQEKHT
jgi:hypothetical protein